MPGRLQKVAALVAVAGGFAAPSLASEDGSGASLAAVSAREAQLDRTALELSESTAVERWSLRAGSYRGAWDPSEASAFPRFDWRSALAGDVARAGLAFDWQRKLGPGRVEASAFARLTRADVNDGATGVDAFGQRLRESSFGAALRWNAGAHALAASFRSTGRDAEGGLAGAGGNLIPVREDRLDESALTLGASTDFRLPAGIRADAGVRYDIYRANVRSDLLAHGAEAGARVVSPQLRLRAPLASGGDVFLTLGRGLQAGSRALTAPIDPRTGTPLARLDPAAATETIEIGFHRRLPPGVEATVSLFRAASDFELMLAGENAITEFSRPTVRQGVQLAARYEPAKWLTLDFHAMALRARFADGAAEYVAGAAERNASASATIRGFGWSASLLVNYLGKRAGIEEVASLRASTFVNGRLSRNLSKNTRVTFDVFNIFDQRLRDVDYFTASRLSNAFGAADNYLFNPAEPRGFRLKLRTTF